VVVSLKPWNKPPTDWIKLSIDGSFSLENQFACTGVVLRDRDDAPLVPSWHLLYGRDSAPEAERRVTRSLRSIIASCRSLLNRTAHNYKEYITSSTLCLRIKPIASQY
jgi:hypothetical protein